jgi:hypothetical protein
VGKRTAKHKKRKYSKILDKTIVVAGAVVLVLGMIKKLINYEKKSK